LNWSEASDLTVAIRQQAKEIAEVEKIIFPPFPYLHLLADLVKHEINFHIGAQNCSEHVKGAFTGEVAAAMIHSTGCAYVLVGHSERRQYFNESAEQLRKKIEQGLQAGLKIIFCFGEQLAERKSGRHFETVQQQLKDVLSHFPKEKVSDLVLAYEPVWAIGTGETASPEQAQEMHAFIRKQVSAIFDASIANDLSILYGGSCNAQNAKELFACADVDGGLIGGASLKAEDFCTIMNSF
jgi:triosephosphate isomerase